MKSTQTSPTQTKVAMKTSMKPAMKAPPKKSAHTKPAHRKLDQMKPGQMELAHTRLVKPFIDRHIGSSETEIQEILKSLGATSLEELIDKILPSEIPRNQNTKQEGKQDSGLKFKLDPPLTESQLLQKAKEIAKKNQIFKSYIGMGYKNSLTPKPLQRHILENPYWYSSYTPYQSELSQGRLEALLNFQTMVCDLTGMPIANASLLDEGTALAEALALAKNANTKKSHAKKVFVDNSVFPHSLEVLKTRALAWGWELVSGQLKDFEKLKDKTDFFAAILQYPATDGSVYNPEEFIKKIHQAEALAIVATDLLSLGLLKPPGEMGADVVVGSSQNFGIPLFFGGPHAGFLSTKKEFIRLIPGRIVGVSKDRHGKVAYRLSLQTREQHIRRERATSNICTAQALLAVMAGFYAVYHGPENLKRIALKIHQLTKDLHQKLKSLKGIKVLNETFFDTLSFQILSQEKLKLFKKTLREKQINIPNISENHFSITLDETCENSDLQVLKSLLDAVFVEADLMDARCDWHDGVEASPVEAFPPELLRQSAYLTHPVFNSYHSETELTRYIYRLQSKELALNHSMIPLGSCTMKLNAVTELLPLSWPEFSDIHPFAPPEQTQGYQQIIKELEDQLCELTGFKAFSFQPNAGSQGEYAGLLAIKKYHESQGEAQRNICFIPASAHGTNPASAVMAGLKVVGLACTKEGLIDQDFFEKQLEKHGDNLAGIMMTYPSTYGFFESVKGICEKVHKKGGLVYLDGANMNALLALCKPADLGFDVCHLNLHKSFCIPHGGGGPGVGPVGVNEKLKAFLPGHSVSSPSGQSKRESHTGAISSAPYGSAGILVISWAYIKMMGAEGLKKCAQMAIANANYIAQKLKEDYKILYTDSQGYVAHECIIDLRKFKNRWNITTDDIAKRLMDYSFHSPTMSWPVPGTLMIEPTESENKKELDRFCLALSSIKKEMDEIEKDKSLAKLLKSAPHTLQDLMQEEWDFPYSKQKAFYPASYLKERKFWPPVSRIENAYGDIHPFCSCPPIVEESQNNEH